MSVFRGNPGTLKTTHAEDSALLPTWFVRFWAAVAILVLLAAPYVLNSFWTGIVNQTFIALIGALALNLLMGTTGQISLGHAGFVGAGAFTAAALITQFDAPFGVNLLAATVVGAILGVLVGLPALRLKGLYLAVSTLAAHFVIVVAMGQYQSSVSYGAGFTMPAPSFLGWELSGERRWFYFLLPVALLTLLVHVNWLRSAFGRAWMAIHHRDVSASALGIDTARFKLLAFSASTAVTAFSGALWGYYTGFVSVEAFDIHLLIQYLAIVIIGGLGSVLGSVLGAAFVMTVPHLIARAAEGVPALKAMGASVFELQIGLFGLIMLLFILLEPRGLAGLWFRVQAYFQLWPFRFRAWER